MPVPHTLDITTMGARGEGVAEIGNNRVFIPFTLPGEQVEADMSGIRGQLTKVLKSSPERVEPSCKYFGSCGGCQLQHWEKSAYQAFKRKLVVDALARAGIMHKVAPLVDASGEGRRRATLHGRNGHSGYMGLRSHFVQKIDRCPILVPALARAPEIAATVAKLFEECDIAITAARNGLDVAIKGKLKKKQRMPFPALSEIAQRFDLARLTANGELILAMRPPEILMGKAIVSLPPGSFLQATAEAEQTLADLVTAPLAGAKRAADLFAGLGPFALRLAETAKVFAADSDAAAVAACDAALRATPGLKIIGTEKRDLLRDPLIATELNTFDAVVFDPPRSGAAAQAEQLASSKVPLVAAVSCDPQSFARDAALLLEGGFKVKSITPVDQFLWSAHVEMVGIFQRDV